MNDKECNGFRNIERSARQLPQEIQPSRDLWPAIEARLETTALPADSVERARRWPQAAAAAIVVVIASSLATTLYFRSNDTPETPVAERSVMPVMTGPGVGAPDLLAVSGLSDDDRDIVISNLDIVRAARISIEKALLQDPYNTALNSSWLRVYEQELDLLNDAVWATSGLDQRVKT